GAQVRARWDSARQKTVFERVIGTSDSAAPRPRKRSAKPSGGTSEGPAAPPPAAREPPMPQPGA
ncbi:MAG: hypothetical protein ACXU8V_22550, partial [Caulobacteraceae bacterium]